MSSVSVADVGAGEVISLLISAITQGSEVALLHASPARVRDGPTPETGWAIAPAAVHVQGCGHASEPTGSTPGSSPSVHGRNPDAYRRPTRARV